MCLIYPRIYLSFHYLSIYLGYVSLVIWLENPCLEIFRLSRNYLWLAEGLHRFNCWPKNGESVRPNNWQVETVSWTKKSLTVDFVFSSEGKKFIMCVEHRMANVHKFSLSAPREMYREQYGEYEHWCQGVNVVLYWTNRHKRISKKFH